MRVCPSHCRLNDFMKIRKKYIFFNKNPSPDQRLWIDQSDLKLVNPFSHFYLKSNNFLQERFSQLFTGPAACFSKRYPKQLPGTYPGTPSQRDQIISPVFIVSLPVSVIDSHQLIWELPLLAVYFFYKSSPRHIATLCFVSSRLYGIFLSGRCCYLMSPEWKIHIYHKYSQVFHNLKRQ